MKTNKNQENTTDVFETFSNSIANKVIEKIQELKEQEKNEKAKAPEDTFLNTQEACNFIKTTPQTLTNYVKAGLIKKYVRGGRGNFYKKSNLINFLENGVK